MSDLPPPRPPDCRRGNVFSAGCPSRQVLTMLAEKWSVLILHSLSSGPRRTAELRRHIGGISEKMLIQTLRRLERSGFVERRAYPEVPPRVDYRLTELGLSLGVLMRDFDSWVEERVVAVRAAEIAFDAARDGARGH